MLRRSAFTTTPSTPMQPASSSVYSALVRPYPLVGVCPLAPRGPQQFSDSLQPPPGPRRDYPQGRSDGRRLVAGGGSAAGLSSLCAHHLHLAPGQVPSSKRPPGVCECQQFEVARIPPTVVGHLQHLRRLSNSHLRRRVGSVAPVLVRQRFQPNGPLRCESLELPRRWPCPR